MVKAINWEHIERLTKAFPEGFINGSGEFVAHKSGECFSFISCDNELDVKCKVIEWFSRAAYKTEPYSSRTANEAFHEYMLNGINRFLGTRFIRGDMEVIYTYLGNAIRHEKTIEFIEAEYNMGFFDQFTRRN